MCDSSFSEDIQLWERLLEGDRNALSQLFRKYCTPLLNYELKLIKRQHPRTFFVIWKQRDRLSEVEYVRSCLYLSLRRTIFRANEIRNVRNRRDIIYLKESFKEMVNQEQLMMDELKQEERDNLQRHWKF